MSREGVLLHCLPSPTHCLGLKICSGFLLETSRDDRPAWERKASPWRRGDPGGQLPLSTLLKPWDGL